MNESIISVSRYGDLVLSLVLLILVACSSPSSPQVQLIGNQELIELQASGNFTISRRSHVRREYPRDDTRC